MGSPSVAAPRRAVTAHLPFLALAALALPARAEWINFTSTNAVNGCGDTCVNNGDFICLGTFSTVDECARACELAPGCALYTHSSGTSHCWTRRDTAWFPLGASGAASACDSSRVHGGSVACGPPAPHPPTRNLTAAIDSATPRGGAGLLARGRPQVWGKVGGLGRADH